MSSVYDVQPMKIRALHADVIVKDMDFGEMITAGGIVVQSDNAKVHGIKPRWAEVYKVGPEQKDVVPGQWILIEHGRWTRKIKIDDGDGAKEIQKVEVKSILAVADEKPNDFYLGTEYGHGASATIRPEDFGAR
jgi:co-chaperonin GroES (HSP10)